MSNRAFRIAWATWAAVGAGLEVWALRDKEKGDTLSEQIWGLFKWPVLWWTGAGVLAWAVIHFLGKGKYG